MSVPSSASHPGGPEGALRCQEKARVLGCGCFHFSAAFPLCRLLNLHLMGSYILSLTQI